MMEPNNKQSNAKKWTIDIVSEHLLFLEHYAETGQCLFIGRALARRGLSRYAWNYWKKIFADNEDLMEHMLLIESLFEANLVEGALNKQVHPLIARLTLCYNYNWTESPQKTNRQLSLLKKHFKGL